MSLNRWSRSALGLSLGLTLVIASWLPLPPSTPHEWTAVGIFGALFVLEAAALVLAGRRAFLPGALIYGLGGLGAVAAVTHLAMIAHGTPDDHPAAFVPLVIVLSLLLAAAAMLRLLANRAPPEV